MPCFVLLYHECPPEFERASHWDLMLEVGQSLRTWALPNLPRGWHAAHEKTAEFAANCPAIADDDSVRAEQLGDHRLAYLHDEGPLSGDRGAVRRIDAGTYAGEAVGTAAIVVSLQGALIRGQVSMKMESPPRWELEVGAD